MQKTCPKNFKVKTNYLRHDSFIYFRGFGNLSYCREKPLKNCDKVFNKNVY